MISRVSGGGLALALLIVTTPGLWAQAGLDTAGSLGVTVAGVDSPGTVFSVLSEGVAAYAAKRSQEAGMPTDQYGNLMTPGYISAQMPDSVSTELQAFLIEYYADKPGFVVAGNAGAAAAIAIERAQAAAAAAAAAAAEGENGGGGSSGGGRDDDDDDDPDNQATPRPGDDDGSVDTGDPPDDPGGGNDDDGDGGGEEIPDLNRPTATAEALRNEYGVFVATEPQQFDQGELGLVKQVLSSFPRHFYEFEEHPDAQHITFVREEGGDDGIGKLSAQAARVIVTDGTGGLRPTNERSFEHIVPEARSNVAFTRHVARLVASVGLAHHPDTGAEIEPDDHPMTEVFARLGGWTRSGGSWTGGQSAGISAGTPASPADELELAIALLVSDPEKLKRLNQDAYDLMQNYSFSPGPAAPEIEEESGGGDPG